MRISTITLLLLTQLGPSSGDDDCAPIKSLGTPSLERYDYSISMEVDAEDCAYHLEIKFQHDATLPIPTDPATQCDPAINPPALADDGLPYFAFRWSYERAPDDIQKATGIDHISVDYSPCGHPPLELFATPHYDLHMYRLAPEERTCMTCAQPPGVPVCDPTPGAQVTESGLAFLDIGTVPNDDPGIDMQVQRSVAPDRPSNMPEGFEFDATGLVPQMGGHAWNPRQNPPGPAEWVRPIWVMCPYNATIAAMEPMIPLAYMIGDADRTFAEELSYEGQTIAELPTLFGVKYTGGTGETVITLKGTSADKSSCKMRETDEEVTDEELRSDGDAAEEGTTTGAKTGPEPDNVVETQENDAAMEDNGAGFLTGGVAVVLSIASVLTSFLL